MDVKWLPGWEEDTRIKSVNIVDEASNLQHIYPFFETETSEVLPRQYRQWTRAYGRPCWLKVKANRTNLGEMLRRALEADGTKLLDVPGEAHEQVNRVEVHGRYFEDMLARVFVSDSAKLSDRVAGVHSPDHGSPKFSHKTMRLQPLSDTHWP